MTDGRLIGPHIQALPFQLRVGTRACWLKSVAAFQRTDRSRTNVPADTLYSFIMLPYAVDRCEVK